VLVRGGRRYFERGESPSRVWGKRLDSPARQTGFFQKQFRLPIVIFVCSELMYFQDAVAFETTPCRVSRRQPTQLSKL